MVVWRFCSFLLKILTLSLASFHGGDAQGGDLTLEFFPPTFVPKSLMDVPSFCIGAKDPCYRKCAGIIGREDLFVCFFVAPQTDLSDQFSVARKLSARFRLQEKMINVTTNMYRPDLIAKTVAEFCSAYDVGKVRCQEKVLPHVKRRAMERLAMAHADMYTSGGYKSNPKQTTVFLHSVKDRGIKLFLGMVTSKNSGDIAQIVIAAAIEWSMSSDNGVCNDFGIRPPTCSYMLGLLKKTHFFADSAALAQTKRLSFRQNNSAEMSTVPFSGAAAKRGRSLYRSQADFYQFCLSRQCSPEFFMSMSTLIGLQNNIHMMRQRKRSMTVLGLNSGTDKVHWHGYQKHYETRLEAYRSRPIRVLEIGLREGASLELWSAYFHPDSEIFGIDYGSIDPHCAPCNIHGALCFHGDQENRTFLELVLKRSGGNFDIIIDDGGHGYGQQMVSFEVLFERALKPGGVYFIEDIETSYWTDYEQYGNRVRGGKNHPNAPLTTFLQATHIINREFHNHSDTVMFPLDRLINSVSFAHNLIEIVKRTVFPDVYDDRQYRYSYTMENYGKATKQVPPRLHTGSLKEGGAAIHRQLANPHANGYEHVHFDRFVSHDALPKAVALNFCLPLTPIADHNGRRSCTERTLNALKGGLIDPNEPFLAKVDSLGTNSKEKEVREQRDYSTEINCSLLQGGKEPFCYVPKMCYRARDRQLVLIERQQSFPATMLELLPSTVQTVTAAAVQDLPWLDSAVYVGRGSYGFAHTAQDFFPAFGLARHSEVYDIPLIKHIVLSDFDSSNRHETLPWLGEFLRAIEKYFVIHYGWSSFDKTGGVCFNGVLHRNMSGIFTWKNTGWKDPINWFDSVPLPERIRNGVEQGLSCGALGENRDAKPSPPPKTGQVLIVQRNNQYRHLNGIEKLIQHVPFEISRPPKVVAFEGMPLCDQIKIVKGADVIIAPHGAGLTNLVFASRCTAVVELFPYNYYIPGFYGSLAQQAGLAYAAWYDDGSFSEASIPACMKSEWIHGGTDVCHMTPMCRSCARDANITLGRNKEQLDSILFSISQALRLQSECYFRGAGSNVPFYGWIPNYSRYGFREDWTENNIYGYVGDIASNIAIETIPGDVLHVGRYKTGLFIDTMKRYFEKFKLTNTRICAVEFNGKDGFCLRYISPGVWEEETDDLVGSGCISFLHVHGFYEHIADQGLRNHFDRVSVGGYVSVSRGSLESSFAKRVVVDFISDRGIQEVSSVQYSKDNEGEETFLWRRWVRTKEHEGTHWCGRTGACRKQFQYFVKGQFSVDTKRSNELQQELCYNQFRPSSKELRLYHTGSGLGSFVHFLSMTQSLALQMKRKIVARPGPMSQYYGFHNYTECPEKDLSCYFQKLWESPAQNTEPECKPYLKNMSHDPTSHPEKCLYLSFQRYTLLGQTPPFNNNTMQVRYFIPKRYRKHGILFMRSQLQWFVLQPNTMLFCAIAFTNLKSIREGNYIAAHIRHGDKGTESLTFHLNKYIKPLETIAERTSLHRVFISTEDQTVIDALQHFPQFDFFYTEGHGRHNVAIEELVKAKQTNPLEQALIAFRNLFIASMGSGFVGTFSSNWSRMVYELMVATHGGESHVDFFSLDKSYFT
jgi:hypothetical protein